MVFNASQSPTLSFLCIQAESGVSTTPVAVTSRMATGARLNSQVN